MGQTPDIADAVAALNAGKLAAFPTETVYGLGADACSDTAVAAIYAAKGRPQFNPLIMHVAGLQEARRYGTFSEMALKLAEAFWPGPLTLVVPKSADCPVSLLATAGLDSIALRVPTHPMGRALLTAFGGPVAAPSANLSGRLSPTHASHVREQLGDKVAEIVDGGPTEVGLESTIVSCLTDPPSHLRAGGVAREEIEQALGLKLAGGEMEDGKPISPGQLQHHYAPKATLRLHAERAEPGEALLALGPDVPAHEGAVLNLSPSGDLQEAAANLFAFLHELDARAGRIAVMPVPETGLGEAINDRLHRAAAPRTLDV
ncbi:MAG: L-threonylcarbamoyladenylate synthase [Pseudomonadota bacterium]